MLALWRYFQVQSVSPVAADMRADAARNTRAGGSPRFQLSLDVDLLDADLWDCAGEWEAAGVGKAPANRFSGHRDTPSGRRSREADSTGCSHSDNFQLERVFSGTSRALARRGRLETGDYAAIELDHRFLAARLVRLQGSSAGRPPGFARPLPRWRRRGACALGLSWWRVVDLRRLSGWTCF